MKNNTSATKLCISTFNLICDYSRLMCSLQTNSMGTFPDLNEIITTEVLAIGNDSANERGKPTSQEKNTFFLARFPITAIWV